MNKKFTGRLLSIGLTASLIISSGSFLSNISVSAEDTVNTVIASDGTANEYNSYISSFTDFPAAEESIALNAETAKLSGDAVLKNDIDGKAAVYWEKGEGSASWTVTVSSDTYYNLKLIYSSVATGVDYSFAFEIDGKTPFDEASSLSFPRLWQDSQTEFRVDDLGNELTPEQTEIDGYAEIFARSSTGVTVDPYAFYLSAGTHTVTLKNPEQPVAVAGIVLSAQIGRAHV